MNAVITDALDALWYVYITITTVGYGDLFPVTDLGGMIGALTMTVGVGLFGTTSSFLANIFIKDGRVFFGFKFNDCI